MPTSIRVLVSTPALLSAFLIAFVPTNTAHGAKSIEEVTVTAQRRVQSTQEVPIAITGMSADAIEKFGFNNANDIGEQVPNMQVSGPYGDVQPIFAIRGVSMSDYNSNQVSPIGVYIDEAYLPATYSHGAAFFDVERLEVLRGPQGTLYGKNTTGGAINVITKAPTVDDGFSGRIKVGAGNYGATSAELTAEDTLIPGKLALRLGYFLKKDDGYTENRLHDSNSSQTDARGYRAALTYDMTDNTSLVVKYSRVENDAYTTSVINQPGVDVRNTSTGAGDSNGFIDYTGYSRPSRDLDFHEVESNKVGALVTSVDIATATFNWDLDGFSIVSVSSYADAKYKQAADTDGSPLTILEIDWKSDTIAYSQDLRLVSDTDNNFNYVVGLFAGYEQYGVRNQYTLFEDLPDTRIVEEDPDRTGLGPFVVGFGIIDQRFKTEKESLASYGQMRFDINEKVGVDFGLRYSVDTNDLTYINISRLDFDGSPIGSWVPGNTTGRDEAFTPLNISPNDFIACINANNCADAPGFTHGEYTLDSGPKLSVTEREFTGKIGVDYKFSDDTFAYASYSKGFRSGAYNGGVYYLARDEDNGYAAPEFIDAYEIGFKTDFLDGRARLNSAVFFYDYTDQQFINVVGISVFLENAGASQIFGAEAEFQYAVNDRFKFNIGLGVLETKFKELSLADTTTIADANDQEDLSGNELISAPAFSGNISIDWDLVVSEFGLLTLNLNSSFQDDQWYSAYNDDVEYDRTGQDAYELHNARLSWFGDDYKYTIALWGKNLTDEEYSVYDIDIQAGFGFTYALPGQPRRYGLELSYNF